MNWRLGARTLGKKALMYVLYPLLRPLVEAVIDADTRNIERWYLGAGSLEGIESNTSPSCEDGSI